MFPLDFQPQGSEGLGTKKGDTMFRRIFTIAAVATFIFALPAEAKRLSANDQKLLDLTEALHKRLAAIEITIANAIASRDPTTLEATAIMADDAASQYMEKASPLMLKVTPGAVKVSAMIDCQNAALNLGDVVRYVLRPETPENLKERRLFLSEYRRSIEICEQALGLKAPANGIGRGQSLEDF